MERVTSYEECPTDDLVETIGQLHALESATRRELLRVIAAYDRREAWREDGARTMADWLVARFGMEHRTAAELARTAAELESLPALGAAFGEGRLDWDQLVAARRLATPENDAELAEAASGASAAELRARARRERHIDDAAADGIQRRRKVQLWWDEGGEMLRLSGRLGAAAGAVLEKVLMRLADDIPPDPVSGLYDTLGERLADALGSLAATRLAADADADRATVVIHLEGATLETRRGVGEIEDGGVIPLADVDALLCDSKVEWCLEENGVPIGVGRKTRTVPRWLLRQLKRRDGACRFPGCGRTRWLHAHHVVFWSQGGRTDLDNLVLLCSFHHHTVHRRGLRIEGKPSGEISFVRNDGYRMPSPAPPVLGQRLRDLVDWVVPVAVVNTS